MKKLSFWLAVVGAILALPVWAYSGFIYYSKEQINNLVANLVFWPAMVGSLLFLVAFGIWIYLAVKGRPKKVEVKGRREMAKYRMKARWPVFVVFLLVLIGMVIWGWNATGWQFGVAFLLLIVASFGFIYYMFRMDVKQIGGLNAIRKKHGFPVRTKVSYSNFLGYLRQNFSKAERAK